MKTPKPEPGLVIRYSYLWHDEAQRGIEEGRKDRPCAIVIATTENKVSVLPITHTKPPKNSRAIEIPAEIKKQLGLDHEKSWIVTTEFNVFTWPGYDLRPASKGKWDFGKLSPNMTRLLQERFKENAQELKLERVGRDDPEITRRIKERDKDRNTDIEL